MRRRGGGERAILLLFLEKTVSSGFSVGNHVVSVPVLVQEGGGGGGLWDGRDIRADARCHRGSLHPCGRAGEMDTWEMRHLVNR